MDILKFQPHFQLPNTLKAGQNLVGAPNYYIHLVFVPTIYLRYVEQFAAISNNLLYLPQLHQNYRVL